MVCALSPALKYMLYSLVLIPLCTLSYFLHTEAYVLSLFSPLQPVTHSLLTVSLTCSILGREYSYFLHTEAQSDVFDLRISQDCVHYLSHSSIIAFTCLLLPSLIYFRLPPIYYHLPLSPSRHVHPYQAHGRVDRCPLGGSGALSCDSRPP